ncbi:hypothetical protein V5799_022620, partial [Amblyomma americanum]
MPYMLENDVFGEEKNWELVTPEQIRELRQHFLDTWNEEDDLYYDEDVKKIRESDDFCRKIIAHVRLDMELAHKVAAYHLRWRRYVKIQVVLRCKNYTKGQAEAVEVKRVFLFFLEKLYNDYGAKKVTMVFDCSGAGLSNM